MNLKKFMTGALTGAILLGSTVLPVFAGAGKAPLYNAPSNYTCPTGAVPAPSDPIFGFAVINTNSSGNLEVEVSVKGGVPNTTYDLYVNQDPGGCPTVATGTLTTNNKGNGNGHVQIAQVTGATNYWVSAVGGGQVLRSTAVQTP